MTAGKYDITIDQGSDFANFFAVKENGAAKNLTGYNARAQMRAKYSDTTPAATFTCTMINASEGTLKMELGPSVTKLLTPGTYYYDLEIYTSNDVSVIRLLQGKVTLTPEVTK
jgi:hypothetical protein